MKRYPKYKDSGVEWIGDIPEYWKLNKVVSHINLVNGFPFTSDFFNHYEGLPLVRIRNITIGKTETYYSGEYLEESIIDDGDILIGMDGDFLARWWEGGKALLNQRCCCLKTKKTINKRFLYYLLQYPLNIINDLTYFTTVKHISSRQILRIKFPFPSIIEQKSIANYLDHKTHQIDTLIDKKQKQIELLKEQRTAVINHAVTKGLNPDVKMKDSGIEWLGEMPAHWELKKLKYVVKSVMTGSTPPTNQEEYYNDGIFNWFSPGDFGEDIKLLNAKRKITEIALNDGKARFFDKHSVLLVGIGATLGKIGILEDNGSSNQQINAITFIDEFNPYYGAYYLDSISDIIVSLSNFATLPIFNQTQTKDILILVPPIDEQNEINKYIFKIDDQTKKSTRKINSQIELLREYRTTLISDAVTGKIDVR